MMQRVKQLLFEHPHGCYYWQIVHALLPDGEPYDRLHDALIGLESSGEIVERVETAFAARLDNPTYMTRDAMSYRLAPSAWLQMAREQQDGIIPVG